MGYRVSSYVDSNYSHRSIFSHSDADIVSPPAFRHINNAILSYLIHIRVSILG